MLTKGSLIAAINRPCVVKFLFSRHVLKALFCKRTIFEVYDLQVFPQTILQYITCGRIRVSYNVKAVR